MTPERCDGCNRVLLHVAGELRCCNVHCITGHQDLAAASCSRGQGAKPAVIPLLTAGDSASFSASTPPAVRLFSPRCEISGAGFFGTRSAVTRPVRREFKSEFRPLSDRRAPK